MSEKKHENSGLVASAKVRRKPRAAWAIAGLGLVLSACAGQESAQVEEDNAAVGEGAPAVEMVGQAVEQDETAGDPAAPGAAPGGGSAPGAGEKTVWVVMKDKPNLSAATSARGWKAKGRAVYQALSQQAQTSQAPLLSWLSAQQVQYKSFWAVNTVKVTADAATIAALEARPDVEKVVDDFQLQIAPPSRGSAKSVVQTVEWNIAEVGAPSAWSDFGTTGEGIVVGTIDTGVQFDHPALVNQYRGKQEDGSFVHDYNWYDPSNVCGFPSDTPCDNADHGTHTMGTIAGDDGGENQIGVAPGVRWMAAKGCEDFSCSFDALLSSGQWMLAPTDISGNNPDPDMRPHVVSNSWGGGGGDTFYMEIVDAWIAAGIFPVFSNGNSGPYCGSSGSPGDYAQSYSAGAYDESGLIAFFSSRGPSFDDGIKPNIAAPGVEVRSSVPGNQYEFFSGTSMAAPHIAGAVALLWSAAPAIQGDIEATRELFDTSAIDTDDTSCGGDAGNNNTWGEGKLNIVGALENAPIGPTGYLAGNVSTDDGEPILGAKVAVTGTADRNKKTDADGNYNLRLPVGGYDATVSAFGYLAETETGVTIDEDVTTPLDFSLTSAPRFDVDGVVKDAAGGRVVGAKILVLDTPLSPDLTDDRGRFDFDDVPQGEYMVSVNAGGCYTPQVVPVSVNADAELEVVLERVTDAYGYQCHPTTFDYISADTVLGISGDDDQTDVALPFTFSMYGEAYDSVTVTTNGYIAFDSPFPEYFNTGIPNSSPPNAAIYGVWDDLFVDGGGQVLTTVVGEAPTRKVVFEWRDVAFLADESQHVSFEIVLSESGEITVQYQTAEDPLATGQAATAGIENPDGDVGLQFSYNESSFRSGLSVVYEVPFAGFVQGTVIDKNDQNPIAGALVAATNADGVTRSFKTNADGFYRVQIRKGRYDLTVSKDNYVSQSKSVAVKVGETSVRDFTLKTPLAVVTPPTLQLVIPEGGVRTRTLTLSNDGSAPLQFAVKEAGGRKQQVTPTALLEREASKDPLAYNSDGLFVQGPSIEAISPMAPGDVLFSFPPTGVDFGWGIGLADKLWVSDVYMLKNDEFESNGTPTGNSHATPWAGYWPGDMAYDLGTNTVCQLAVGGDNGIYCWNPSDGAVVNTITGSPWSNISQRGLAHKDSDDTFFVGGWNEGVIYHVQGASGDSPGSVISSCMPADGNISGLAYNEAMDVLWVATNSDTDTIYEVNPYDCTVLSTLAPPQGGGFQGAGLELDPEGNLWAVAQSPNLVYLMDSGVPSFSDVSWLTVEPTEGELAVGAEQELEVTIDTTGLEPGLYLATLFVQSNSGREATVRIPVSLVVSGYVQAVNAGGTEYLDSTGELWSTDQKHVNGSWGYVKKGEVVTTPSDIKSTEDPALYQSQRDRPYAYRFDDVPNGVYEVDLRFAEIQDVGVGQRLFDVIIENELVLPAHDIAYEVGRNEADPHTFFVEVTDNRVDVRFIARGTEDPAVNALRVVHRPDR